MCCKSRKTYPSQRCVANVLHAGSSSVALCMCNAHIMAYSSTPYVGMTPEKMGATLKVHK